MADSCEKKELQQVISRVLFPIPVTRKGAMIIHLGRQLPAASSDLPESTDGQSLTLSYSVLLRMGFTKLSRSPGKLVSSYLTFSPLPAGRIPPPQGTSGNRRGGIFSVALSLGLPPVAVSDHPALWSSDFPPARKRTSDHLPCYNSRFNRIDYLRLVNRNFGHHP